MSGRHTMSSRLDEAPRQPSRPTGLLSRRSVRVPLIVLGSLAAMGLGTIVVKAVAADADGCSSGGVQLSVVADPAIAPAITEIGAKFTASRPSVEGKCIRVDVVAKPSHELANSLGTYAGHAIDVAAKPAPTPSEAELPVVWIPDSSYWLARVKAVDQEMFDPNVSSVASSRVVLALPEAVAREFGGQLSNGLDAGSLKLLLKSGKIKFGAIDPRQDTAGMIGAVLLQTAIVASEADLPLLVGAYRQVAGPMADMDALWKAFGESMQAAPVSEQAVLAFNATGTVNPMAAVPLAEVPTLDFPYAVRSHQPRALATAAGMFRAALASEQHRSSFSTRGLRGPDGAAAPNFPTGHGVTAAALAPQPVSDMANIRNALRIWVAAKTPSRVIALVDATSSMGKLMGGDKTRLDVLRATAVSGLNLFTDNSKVGLWGYAGSGHSELVPLAELDKAQRDRLKTAVDVATPSGTDVCPLYQTIVEGYRALLADYDPEHRNTLVVFTDGRDNTAAEIRKIQRELERLTDVTKPIRVVLLGIGPEVKLAELQTIADTTGGVAFQVSDPREMQAIFLRALLA